MSGWRRLWVVFSVLLGAPIFFASYNNRAEAQSSFHFNGDSKAFWAAAHADSGLKDCNWATAKASRDEYSYDDLDSWTVSCRTKDPLTPAFLFALLPAAIIAATGLTVRWVYRGFRSTPPQ